MADTTTRTIELFTIHAIFGVIEARRFRAVGGNLLFYDRYRRSPPEDQSPDEPTLFMETLLYREPDEIVSIEEYVPGEVSETVFPYVDLSGQYMPTPAPGDWGPIFAFAGLPGG